MGSDNFFHKKRKRKARDLERKLQQRQQQKRILIACEDSKSSAFYFEDMARAFGLKAVEVRGKECGTAPISVLEYASWQQYESERAGDPYDRVYCVFDRDQHDSFELAVREIGKLNQEGKPFYAITSTPCFEIWLLMHFKEVTNPFRPTGKSPCDQVVSLLRKEKSFSKYGKGQSGIYDRFSEKQKRAAIVNAKRLSMDNKKIRTSNPSTNIHELVAYLMEIKDSKN